MFSTDLIKSRQYKVLCKSVQWEQSFFVRTDRQTEIEKLLVYFQGYFGCAVGKAKQAAKTEIEKLKLADMTSKELVKEAARM